MAKRKNYYYVLVMTDSGPTFVTSIPERNWANYDKLEKPMEFGSKDYAQEVANGLCLNFQLAYMVNSNYEIPGQPYLYSKGQLKWEWNSEEND